MKFFRLDVILHVPGGGWFAEYGGHTSRINSC